ncbi:FixH family protein [Maribius pontilimi]|uniref:FixH family protein n=1 Tax=Palleronia pontilimi TaxID=1964209 RepID=A0A934IA56_9RHOB|nr:FixH family protein [Palleronia pontilimi]MBJ3763329.1 FixH family protein [Palleronia pontilimi]
MTPSDPHAGPTLTGWHVLAMFAGGFGIIIAVNLALAVNAVRTFPGLETESAYVASQTFDADRAAQDALGWTVSLAHDGALLRLAIVDASGRPVHPRIVEATLGRATTVAQDRTPAFAWDGSALSAPADLAPGNWNLRVVLEAADGALFRRRIPLRIAR